MGRDRGRKTSTVDVRPTKERTLLVGVQVKSRISPSWQIKESLKELDALVVSAGAKVVASRSQLLPRMNSSYIGKGKIEELREIISSMNISTVVLDDELSVAQQRKLEEAFKVKIVDRTALILDIFSQRAQSKEGRLQVELAQLDYLLPRLAGQWSHLERLGGGIGTRGPGESQLETDRRLVRKRVDKIKSQLNDVRQRRGRVRQNRSDRGVPTVSLVGYTNAGKSTLMNSLTQSNVLAEDKLFATLDPVTRRLRLPHGGEALLTDTVGFINKLPHSLVASFRATLEELRDASLLIHVIDLSQRNNIAQYKSVVSLLKELDLDTKPTIHVLNKIDVIENSSDSNISTKLRGVIKENYGYEDSILVSAREKHNLATLKAAIGHQLSILNEPH